MQELMINPEFKDLIPALSAEELSQLEENIIDEGCREPIIVWNDTIIDGHNRYAICTKHNIPFHTDKEEFEDEASVKIWIIKNQFGRRNLQLIDRGLLYLTLKPLLQEKAKKNLIEMGKIGGQSHGEKKGLTKSSNPFLPDSDIVEDGEESDEFSTEDNQLVDRIVDFKPVNTRKELAKMANISEDTLAKVEKIKNSSPDMIAKIRNNEMSINKAYTGIKRKEQQERNMELKINNPIPTFDNKYDVIVIDPPWNIQKIEREIRPDQATTLDYPTMTDEEIEQLTIPAADDCHLFLWTTQRYLPMAIELIKKWDFKYILTFVWHKPGGFQPYGLPQYNCEFIIYGRKGTPKFIDTKQFSACFNAPRGKHSEKPEEFYDILRRVSDGKRLDMFSRRHIDGFDSWGNEVKDDSVER